MALTPKQARFVEEYLVDFNGTQAAIRSGYSPKTAQEQSSRLLSNVMVAEAVEAGRAIISEKAGIDQTWVLQRLATVAQRCMQAEQVFDRKGGPVLVETDEGEIAKAFVFNAAGANGALGLIGKHLGMFTEKVDVNHGVQNSLAELMTRIDGKSRGLP